MLETFMKLCMTPQIFGKTFFASKIGEINHKNTPEIGSFEFREKIFINFHRFSSIMKFFGKYLTPQKWAKMLSANQVVVILNQLFLQITPVK